MKKILLINYGYYPAQKYGGPVNSVHNFCELMKSEYGCYILSCNHEMNSDVKLDGISEGWNERSEGKVQYWSDEQINERNLRALLDDLQPDVIYLQSIFEACFVMPILKIKKRGFRGQVIIAPRGDICKGAMRKKYKKLPYLWLLRAMGMFKGIYFHSTADDETKAIKKYCGVKSKIYQIENIPSVITSNTYMSEKKENELHAMFVSRIAKKKNLLQAIQLVKKSHPGVYLDIYGPIEDKEYWNQCLDEIGNMPNHNIQYMGMLNHDDVYREFRRHDVFLFPTRSENYGHVIVESMQCGCPVIISDQTPWSAINEAQVGGAFPLIDEAKFLEKIEEYRTMDFISFKKLRTCVIGYINNHLNIEGLKVSYKSLIEDVIGKMDSCR